MTPETLLLQKALVLLSEGRWAGFLSLTIIWLLYRRVRYLSAALARQQQQTLRLLNETWKTAFGIVLHEQPRTLTDLVEDIETDFERRP